MVSALSSFSGLSSADITALFGTAAQSSDPTAKDGAQTLTSSTTPITGAGGGGTNAAKAIQAIVTQIQVEKMQTSTQGKVSTASLVSASVSASFEKTVNLGSDLGTVSVGVTAIDSVATATADNTADAAGMLLSQVKAQEAQIEAAQGGALMTKEEIAFGHGNTSNLVTWTANSVTVDTKGVANRGVELYEEEGALSAPAYFSTKAQKFQASSATDTSEAGAPTSASSGNASSPSSTGPTSSALYLVVSRDQAGSFDALLAKEQELVSAFENSTLSGQNETAPQNGAGFSYSWGTEGEEGEDESFYSISGAMISNYDPTTVAGNGMHLNADQKNAAMGGTVVNDDYLGGSETMTLIIPLKSS